MVLVDSSSIVNALFSNAGLAQLSFGGILGFVIGWASKKLLKLISMIVGATLAVVGLIIAYLSTQKVITINYNQTQVLIANIGQWIIRTAESVLQSAQVSTSSIGIIGGLLLGFMLGFKRG